jgi:hypothetical protein
VRRSSVNIPKVGEFADPRVAEVTRLAEDCGWDGVFIWDVLIGYNTDLVADVASPACCSPRRLPPAGSGWAPWSLRCRAGGRRSWPGRSPPWTGCRTAG